MKSCIPSKGELVGTRVGSRKQNIFFCKVAIVFLFFPNSKNILTKRGGHTATFRIYVTLNLTDLGITK